MEGCLTVGSQKLSSALHSNFFPSNNLELALWLQSERMLHAIIDQDQVDTQNEVVKEEKRDRIDNSPYAKFLYREIDKYMFTNHPYGQSVIGSFEDLDSATLEEFQEFYKKWYNPNNAVLVIAGDLDTEKTKEMVQNYFGDIKNNNEKPSKPDIIHWFCCTVDSKVFISTPPS